MAALALVQTAGAEQFDREGFWEQVRGLGFSVTGTPDYPHQSIVVNGLRLYAYLSLNQDQSKSLTVTRRYLWSNPNHLVDYDARIPNENWYGRIGLDGTVTINSRIRFHGLSDHELRQWITSRADAIRAFEKSFFEDREWFELEVGVRPPLKPLPRHLGPQALDYYDLSYLIRAWGWDVAVRRLDSAPSYPRLLR